MRPLFYAEKLLESHNTYIYVPFQITGVIRKNKRRGVPAHIPDIRFIYDIIAALNKKRKIPTNPAINA